MFTGIIANLGNVVKNTGSELTIHADPELIQILSLGMSISVNGICLTVVSISKNNYTFQIDYMSETSKLTNIQNLVKNDLVNLELPATPNTMLAGHIVQGHVDSVGKILQIVEKENSRIFTISIAEKTSKYIVNKGSIAVNGISLTVIEITDDYFKVGIIPHTWSNTMLQKTKVGDLLNLEVDVFAKYLEKLVKK